MDEGLFFRYGIKQNNKLTNLDSWLESWTVFRLNLDEYSESDYINSYFLNHTVQRTVMKNNPLDQRSWSEDKGDENHWRCRDNRCTKTERSITGKSHKTCVNRKTYLRFARVFLDVESESLRKSNRSMLEKRERRRSDQIGTDLAWGVEMWCEESLGEVQREERPSASVGDRMGNSNYALKFNLHTQI